MGDTPAVYHTYWGHFEISKESNGSWKMYLTTDPVKVTRPLRLNDKTEGIHLWIITNS